MPRLSTLLLICLLSTPALAQLAVPNASGLTYGHVHLNVVDIEENERILVEHFGGVAVQKGFLQAVRLPNMLVALTEAEPTRDSRATVMDHFGFKVRHIDRFLDKWRADGLEVGRIFTGSEGQTNAYVFMPDGAVVEMQEDQQLSTEIGGYHIHFITPNPEELMAWYTDIFGLEVRPRGRITTTTNVPGMNLSFGNSDTERAPTQGTAIDHIGFELDDLEAFCKELEAKGVEFNVSYREIDSIELKIAFITDPNGVYIELTEGYDEY